MAALLATSLSFGQVGSAIMARSKKKVSPKTLVVYYQNTAHTSPKDLKQAFQIAAEPYSRAGINVRFVPLSASSKLPDNPVMLNLSPKRMVSSESDAAGDTVARFSYVYPFAVHNNADELGRAIAHELGHAMGLKHSTVGVMAPRLPQSSAAPADGILSANDPARFFFDSHEKKQLFNTLTADPSLSVMAASTVQNNTPSTITATSNAPGQRTAPGILAAPVVALPLKSVSVSHVLAGYRPSAS